MEKANPFRLVIENLYQNKKGLLQFWLILAGTYLFSLLLGIGVFLVVFGIQIVVSRIFVYWPPVRSWLVKTFDLKFADYDLSNVSPFYRMAANVLRGARLFLSLLIGFYAIKTGVDLLLHDGFLGQNLIYLIFVR